SGQAGPYSPFGTGSVRACAGATPEGVAMPHWWLMEISPDEKILRSLVVYLFLLIMFRLLGKRQVGQMTPFDLIVLLILSNALQNAMIGPDNSLTGGLVGATVILAANWIIGRAAFDSPRLERAIEGVPTVLIHNGKLVEGNLRKETISREELLSNLRTQGYFNLSEVQTAVLEPSGKLSVLKEQPHPSPETPL
ncbi:MAG: DUF421 domain-containing protein, partial [Candidatus Acidiferrales bacterium]